MSIPTAKMLTELLTLSSLSFARRIRKAKSSVMEVSKEISTFKSVLSWVDNLLNGARRRDGILLHSLHINRRLLHLPIMGRKWCLLTIFKSRYHGFLPEADTAQSIKRTGFQEILHNYRMDKSTLAGKISCAGVMKRMRLLFTGTIHRFLPFRMVQQHVSISDTKRMLWQLRYYYPQSHTRPTSVLLYHR